MKMGKTDGKPGPKPVEVEPKEDRDIIKDAKNRLYVLHQRRDTAVNNLAQAIQTAKSAEQQSFILRGRISVFDEEITDIKQKYKLEDPER